MRSSARGSVVVVLAAVLTVAIVLPAWAGQIITYEGKTSQAPPFDDVGLSMLKRDSGRRFLRTFFIFFTETCEDGSTTLLSGIGFNRRRGIRLGENGEFRIDYEPEEQLSIYAYHVIGTVGFGSGDGTFELRFANLNESEEPQLCTTGVVDWSVDRTGSRPTRISRTSLPAGVTFFEVGRHGELVEAVEP